MIRLVVLFASAGAALSVLLVAAWKVSAAAHLWTISRAIAGLMTVLWPASFGLMALHAGSTTSDVILLYVFLILTNALLYGLIGAVLAALIKLRKQ